MKPHLRLLSSLSLFLSSLSLFLCIMTSDCWCLMLSRQIRIKYDMEGGGALIGTTHTLMPFLLKCSYQASFAEGVATWDERDWLDRNIEADDTDRDLLSLRSSIITINTTDVISRLHIGRIGIISS